jgi:hypothetical protein
MEFYWENSSSNSIVKDIIEKATESAKAEIETLISGGCVEKPIFPELTYTDLDNEDASIRQTYLWSVLFATGYLTDFAEPMGKIHKLVIPNKEVLGIYRERIYSWFRVKVTGHTKQWQQFCTAVENGNAKEVEKLLNEFMDDSISIRDTAVRKEMKENYYHGLLLGLLTADGRWVVKSNAESGIGYADIRIEIPRKEIGCVMEVKYAENGAFDEACKEAMEQIEKNGYAEGLKREGMQTIHKFGIACYKKSCKVACQEG